jgi:glutaminyl-tRNA synthetase
MPEDDRRTGDGGARVGSADAAGDAARGGLDFVRERVSADVRAGRNGGRVATRFPPEPNGYLHIGHAKAICLNFGVAAEFGGSCNLRFDDTNPVKEEQEYVDAIRRDVHWLGFDWQEREFYASDYFDRLYDFALQLIRRGKAYVDDLTPDQIREYRGTLTEPGRESPYRDRSVEENLELFERMRAGEFPEGSRTLRARIDMASGNVTMRDPVLYRILKASHHRTGDKWVVYPMYDFTHCLSDSLEGITHSLCTLEFENNRPLYDWVLENVDAPSRPQQIEYARLNLEHTILSKRRLKALVEEGHVDGWDDPRMPTISGLRRRGYTPEAIRAFCDRIGIAKRDSLVDVTLLENALRDHLNARAQRALGVLRPLKVVLVNYPEDREETFEAVNNHEDPDAGTRAVPFARELWIEREDFREDPPRKFFRLSPGAEVRLRYAYLIRCVDVVKDADGEVVELHCTYDPETRGGSAPDGRKVRGTLHWVSARHAVDAQVRLYDRLFIARDPSAVHQGGDWRDLLDPDSLTVLDGCKVEPMLADAQPGALYQLERQGYFCVDSRDSARGRLVLNRSVSLRDTWGRIERRQRSGGGGSA